MTAPLSAAPFVAAAEAAFAVIWKPRNMHTAPLKPDDKSTLLHWCAAHFPEVLTVRGRKPVEGGAVHRLDFATEGLVLFARSQTALNHFYMEQEAGRFVKEYLAITGARKTNPKAGFPPLSTEVPSCLEEKGVPFFIESAFRPYGKGARTVRPIPVLPDSAASAAVRIYQTEVLAIKPQNTSQDNNNKRLCWRIRLRRGFRHQIRCHLAWLGFPIEGDALYGESETPDLGLSSVCLRFRHPSNGKLIEVAGTKQKA
ncbi:MAG: RNA pseudouridine synthase [Spirochaetaceae bacterium]|jgi:23S rRNA pseudouridine1911/1915/1917 synthase|nr:RNA pseudouridine synthase [Spirochaetaceae bacterium]